MRHPHGHDDDDDVELDLDAHGNAMGPDAQAFLDAVLAYELSLRSRVRCVVTGSARSARRSLAMRARARARLRTARSATAGRA